MQTIGLPLERHLALAIELRAMTESISRLVTELSRTVPRDCQAYQSATKTTGALTFLRVDLDSLALQSFPDLIDEKGVYFAPAVVKTASVVA